MRRAWLGSTVSALLACLAATSALAQDAAKSLAYGKHLAQECTSCHRLDGVNNGIPSLPGMPVGDFKATLDFYKSGTRNNPAMVSVAQSLDDEQIEALAQFYASLPPPAKK